jgi:hypothetical protein
MRRPCACAARPPPRHRSDEDRRAGGPMPRRGRPGAVADLGYRKPGGRSGLLAPRATGLRPASPAGGRALGREVLPCAGVAPRSKHALYHELLHERLQLGGRKLQSLPELVHPQAGVASKYDTTCGFTASASNTWLDFEPGRVDGDRAPRPEFTARFLPLMVGISAARSRAAPAESIACRRTTSATFPVKARRSCTSSFSKSTIGGRSYAVNLTSRVPPMAIIRGAATRGTPSLRGRRTPARVDPVRHRL